jgi:hypothetical protein
MRTATKLALSVFVCLVGALGLATGQEKKAATWSIKADYIEACSCHLFCTCYFYPSPEGGHKCEFNNAVKIASGHVGEEKVDGIKIWLSGDLGGDFSKGEMKALVMTFDKGTTDKQKEALKFLFGKIYPVKWASSHVDEQPITWEKNGDDAHAKLGDVGEVTLKAAKDSTGKVTVIHNLTYWGAQKNDGFVLAKATHHYKGHGHDYKYKDMNGFQIHIESEGKIEEEKPKK